MKHPLDTSRHMTIKSRNSHKRYTRFEKADDGLDSQSVLCSGSRGLTLLHDSGTKIALMVRYVRLDSVWYGTMTTNHFLCMIIGLGRAGPATILRARHRSCDVSIACQVRVSYTDA